jgi:hypothetical protein
MKGGKLLTTVQNYQRCDMYEALDVIGMPPVCVIDLLSGSDDFFGGALPLIQA